MLDVARANTLTDQFAMAFNEIGHTGESKMPRSKRNDEPIAWEFHVAMHLARLAEARKEKARKNAVKLGVIFDPEKSPLVPGTNALVYAGEVVEIAVSVTTPATRVDVVALGVALVKSGVKEATFARLLKAATVENRAPHKFTATLCTSS